jgi:hypothetical protein
MLWEVQPGCASHEDDNAVSWGTQYYAFGKTKEYRFLDGHLCFVDSAEEPGSF